MSITPPNRQPSKWKLRLLLLLGVLPFVVYISSYLILSRRGYAEADHYHMKGFYYLTPENTDSWRFWNYTFVIIYSPLNGMDRKLGTGRHPAYEPMWGPAH
jgi:hypothetical protein